MNAAELTVGQIVAEREVVFDRKRLVQYAGASGDFNTIHFSDAIAEQVGLPGVIAHGMLTMGAAVAVLEDWLGDPAAIIDYQTRFTRPVPVPAVGDVTLTVTATVGALTDESVRFDLGVTLDGARVLTKAQAVVKLD
ncbi:MaoC/PaaZ C-terminal domain-containing protein [Rarobacter faecitabidus]|uniref:MaoC dehydratase-like protein n=1 Tax=Rarobacter faecitabidus TaxID=13243 RepID=A0A542ZTX4_RARFA|nr:MaoC/PaaZ C-terminal domain-containing protein [Rarobacter faecitabidus]TQL63767.1 MaoC dehydratase-like protein [Rarobacter faecitabidus]